MLTKSILLLREDTTIWELVRLIKTSVLAGLPDKEASIHQLNADTNECTAAVRALNEKLTQHIEELSMAAIRDSKRNESLERSMLRNSVELQKQNQDKLSNALVNQMSFYEQELGRLEHYKSKITAENYELELNNDIAAAKAQNAQLAKQVADQKLRVNGMAAQTGKQATECQTKRQDLLFKIKYFEEKILKLESAPEGKESFLKKLQNEDKKVLKKIDQVKAEYAHLADDGGYQESLKAAELRAKIERVKSLNDQVSDTLKKQVFGVQADIDRLTRDCAALKSELNSKTLRAEQQAREIKIEEEKIGKTISDVKKFIFKERQIRQDEARQKEVEEKERARLAKFTILRASRKLNRSSNETELLRLRNASLGRHGSPAKDESM